MPGRAYTRFPLTATPAEFKIENSIVRSGKPQRTTAFSDPRTKKRRRGSASGGGSARVGLELCNSSRIRRPAGAEPIESLIAQFPLSAWPHFLAVSRPIVCRFLAPPSITCHKEKGGYLKSVLLSATLLPVQPRGSGV